MSQAPSIAFAAVPDDATIATPARSPGTAADVSLKGTTRGLEILISGTPSAEALGVRLRELLAEAPSFFAGNDARVAFEAALPAGALACLEAVAAQFALKIIEVGPVAARRPRGYAAVIRRRGDGPGVKLADGTGPIADPAGSRVAVAPGAALPPLPGGTTAVPALPAGGSRNAAAPETAAPETAASDGPSDATPIEAMPSDGALANTAPYTAVTISEALGLASGGHGSPRDSRPGEPGAPDPTAPAGPSQRLVGPPELAVVDALAEIALADLTRAAAVAPPGDVAAAPVPSAAVDPAAAEAAAAAAIEAAAAALVAAMPPGPRLVVGPVRSGVIVDHPGHVIVLGDVNPCAEVRAAGSIIVLGRLRGVAHAAIGRDAGFIVALSLAPQQLRIGRMVARAGDANRPSDGAEIAYVTGKTIVVERFTGRLPRGLAASM